MVFGELGCEWGFGGDLDGDGFVNGMEGGGWVG